jgi:hypothetical protein
VLLWFEGAFRATALCLLVVQAVFLGASSVDFSIDIARENSDDVLALIQNKMNDVQRRTKKAKSKPMIDRTDLEQIIVPLIHLSKAVLQWTAWMLPRVIRLIKDGETVEVIVAAIKDYPRELGEVYHEHLSSIGDSDVDIALNVFSWACLQVQPLSIEELRLAVCLSSTPELKSMKAIKAQKNKHWCPNDKVFKSRVDRISGGLFRFVKVRGESFSIQRRTATFEVLLADHDSVSEFLRNNGLKLLYARASPQPFSMTSTLASMAKDCVRYLNCQESLQYMQAWKSITQHFSDSVHIVAGDPPEEIPFIHYAAAALTLYVLKLEEEDGSSDDVVDLLQRLKLSD